MQKNAQSGSDTFPQSCVTHGTHRTESASSPTHARAVGGPAGRYLCAANRLRSSRTHRGKSLRFPPAARGDNARFTLSVAGYSAEWQPLTASTHREPRAREQEPAARNQEPDRSVRDPPGERGVRVRGEAERVGGWRERERASLTYSQHQLAAERERERGGV